MCPRSGSLLKSKRQSADRSKRCGDARLPVSHCLGSFHLNPPAGLVTHHVPWPQEKSQFEEHIEEERGNLRQKFRARTMRIAVSMKSACLLTLLGLLGG
jgi:hypothetical protein